MTSMTKQVLMVHKHYLMGVDNCQHFSMPLDRPVYDNSGTHQLMVRQADVALWLCR